MIGSNTSRVSISEFAVVWAVMTNTTGLPGVCFLFNAADVSRKGSLEEGNLAHWMQLLRSVSFAWLAWKWDVWRIQVHESA